MSGAQPPAGTGRRDPGELPGLQPERTHLAWERSAVGFLAAGALLLLRHSGPVTLARALLAGASLVLSLLVVGLGMRRGRRTHTPVRRGDHQTIPDAGPEVLITGVAVAMFALGAAVVINQM